MNNRPSLHFDGREIAVLFSLFIFVSLLMFTVGILVGKGLTQARYEGKVPSHSATTAIEPLVKSEAASHFGNSVSMGAAHHANPESKGDAKTTAMNEEREPEKVSETKEEEAPVAKSESSREPEIKETRVAEALREDEAPVVPPPSSSLKLIPLKPSPPTANGVHLTDPVRIEAEALLKNPKILSLVEPEPAPKGNLRAPTSAPVTASDIPAGVPKGSFTVQIGSYPNQVAAKERVDALQKLGFPQAFFSAKELGATDGTWFRVWLGYYPNYLSAKKMGDQLQARGEVKNYIVRKVN